MHTAGEKESYDAVASDFKLDGGSYVQVIHCEVE